MASIQVYNREIPQPLAQEFFDFDIFNMSTYISNFINKYNLDFMEEKEYSFEIEDYLVPPNTIYNSIVYQSLGGNISLLVRNSTTNDIAYIFTYTINSKVASGYPLSGGRRIKLKEKIYSDQFEGIAIFLGLLEYIRLNGSYTQVTFLPVGADDSFNEKIVIERQKAGYDVYVKGSYDNITFNGVLPLTLSNTYAINKNIKYKNYANFLSNGTELEDAIFSEVDVKITYAPPSFELHEDVDSNGYRYIYTTYSYIGDNLPFNIFISTGTSFDNLGKWTVNDKFIYNISSNISKYEMYLVQQVDNDNYPVAPYISKLNSISIISISPQLQYVVNEKEGTIDVTCLGGLTIGLNKMTGAGWALVEQKDLNERNYCSFKIRESGKYQLFTIKTKPAYLSETSEDIDVDISLDTPIVSLVLGEVSYYGRDYDNNNIIKTFENQLKITEVKNAMGYRIYKDGELYDIIVNDNNISSAFANVIYKKINKK